MLNLNSSYFILSVLLMISCSKGDDDLQSSNYNSSINTQNVSTSSTSSTTSSTSSTTSSTVSSGSSTSSSGDTMTFNNYLHESLPTEWITEFNNIIAVLSELIPANNVDWFQSELPIYAWSTSVYRPYGEQYSGACICGDDSGSWMVLEIPEDEFTYNSMHRYSVIAHEYFHVHQLTTSQSFAQGSDGTNPNAFDVLWLAEGSAATFESLYIQQYYGVNYFEEGQAWAVNEDVRTSPSEYELKSKQDNNYGSSVFMTLALIKELESNGFTTENAFKAILKDFWVSDPNNTNWKSKFEEIFGFTVESFYSSLINYSLEMSEIYPSAELTIQNIFSD